MKFVDNYFSIGYDGFHIQFSKISTNQCDLIIPPIRSDALAQIVNLSIILASINMIDSVIVVSGLGEY